MVIADVDITYTIVVNDGVVVCRECIRVVCGVVMCVGGCGVGVYVLC